ncbi:iron-siderophore ABC transporter substrate-binding protein [Marinobacter sp. 1Y8]
MSIRFRISVQAMLAPCLLLFSFVVHAASAVVAMESSPLPDHPVRIVSLDDLTTEMLLSLGIEPVGAANPDAYRRQGKPNAEKLENTVSLGSPQQPNLEQLVLLKPDLVLGISSLHSGLFDRLNALAPTLIYRVSMAPSSDDAVDAADTMLRHLAGLTGRQTQAEAVLKRMYGAIRDGRQAAQDLGLTGQPLAVLYPLSIQGRFIVSNEQTLVVSLANRLGGTNPWPLREARNLHRRIDVQALADEDDLHVLFIGNFKGSALFKSRLWQALPVAEHGQYGFLETPYWSFGGAETATAIMRQMTDVLAGFSKIP